MLVKLSLNNATIVYKTSLDVVTLLKITLELSLNCNYCDVNLNVTKSMQNVVNSKRAMETHATSVNSNVAM